jgi:heme/copper-type cytochrome/quinol oxidase subunit 4
MAAMNTSYAPLGSAELLVILFLIGIVVLVAIVPFWLICKKAGLSPWLSLIMVLPLGAILLPFLLAFMDWPALKKDDR